MLRFWMSITTYSRDRFTPPWSLTADTVVFEGTFGKHQYVLLCEGALVESAPSAGGLLTTSVILGGFRSVGRAKGDITVEIDPFLNQIRVCVPMTTVTGMFWHRRPEGLYLSTDPRLLFHPQMQFDQRGLYSLLQFGALIPPLTPWREIGRLIPGNVYTVAGDELKIGQKVFVESDSGGSDVDKSLSPDRQCEEVAAELDRTLRELCPDKRPIILFSGGVDSGLLAARAASMGWRETLLVNLRMGSDDSESAHAKAMAHSLGLSCESVDYCPELLERFLARIGATYSLPFGDFSAFPTCMLVEAVVQLHERRKVVLDGTGGDGTFDFRVFDYRRYYSRKLDRLPRFIFKLGAFMYKEFRVWMWESELGQLLQLMRYFSQMSVLQSDVAQSPLCGIMYHSPEGVKSETHELLDQWLEHIPWTDESRVFNMLDIILVCCGIFAQTGKPIFDASRLDVRYPFLEPNMVKLAMERAFYWPEAKEHKSPLKNLLAQHVPREMVFRPKSGWPPTPLVRQLFESQAFLKGVDRLLQPTSPLSSMLDNRYIRPLRAHLQQKRPLAYETYRFLWLAVFLNLWLDQVHEGHKS